MMGIPFYPRYFETCEVGYRVSCLKGSPPSLSMAIIDFAVMHYSSMSNTLNSSDRIQLSLHLFLSSPLSVPRSSIKASGQWPWPDHLPAPPALFTAELTSASPPLPPPSQRAGARVLPRRACSCPRSAGFSTLPPSFFPSLPGRLE